MRFFRLFSSLALMSAAGFAAAAQLSSDDCLLILAQGRQALETHRFAAATAAFDRIEKQCAHVQQDFPGDHPLPYYSALARTLEAQDLSIDEKQRNKLLNEAAISYEAARSEKPSDISVLNNLGDVYLELGRHDDAARVFAKVMELGGSNPWFRASYAEFLVNTGHLQEAAAILIPIVEKEPSLLEAQLAMFQLRLKRDGADVALKELRRFALTEPEKASQIAIDALHIQDLDDVHKELAFALSVSSLGSILAQRSSARKTVLDQLDEAGRHPMFVVAVAELRALLESDVDKASFPWWSKTARNNTEVDAQLWSSFEAFALSAGGAALRDGLNTRSINIYKTILDLQPVRTVDPVLGLAEVYTASHDAATFVKYVETWNDIFAAPPPEHDWAELRKRYEYHRELALLGDSLLKSSCTGQATAPGDVSPICRALAGVVVSEVDKALASVIAPIKLDAGAFSAAGRAYMIVGNQHDAALSKMNAALGYAHNDKRLSAWREIDDIDNAGLTRYLSEEERSKYISLKSTLILSAENKP